MACYDVAISLGLSDLAAIPDSIELPDVVARALHRSRLLFQVIDGEIEAIAFVCPGAVVSVVGLVEIERAVLWNVDRDFAGRFGAAVVASRRPQKRMAHAALWVHDHRPALQNEQSAVITYEPRHCCGAGF